MPETMTEIERIIDDHISSCYAKINPIGSKSVSQLAKSIEQYVIKELEDVEEKFGNDFEDSGYSYLRTKIINLKKGLHGEKACTQDE